MIAHGISESMVEQARLSLAGEASVGSITNGPDLIPQASVQITVVSSSRLAFETPSLG